ncbi:MAG: hypothetical protein ACRDJU_12880 [Actinomycetota bacterium]
MPTRAGTRRTAVLGPLGGYWRPALVLLLLAGTYLFSGSYGTAGLGPARIAFTLLFMGFGPGLALLGILRLDDLVLEISLAVALSIAIEMVMATGMVMVNHWAPDDEVATMALLTLIGAGAQIVQVARLKRRAGSVRPGTAKQEP